MINVSIILTNNIIDIVYKACKECYKGVLLDDENKKLDYIEDKVKLGHESVLEHSNVVMKLSTDYSDFKDIINLLAYSDFLRFEIIDCNKDNKYYIIIGGSILGYKQLIRRHSNIKNKCLEGIINILYNLPKQFFYDFIKNGIMEECKFKSDYHDKPKDILFSNDRLDIVNIDDLSKLIVYTSLTSLPYKSLFKFITVTIHFKKMSRVISQQLTRHRNAISQASQRYINYSNAEFFSPIEFREDKTEVNIEFDGKTYTSKELGNYMIKAYQACIDAGMKKEEARSYLPNNTSTSLYVTFTLDNLLHFLKLRTSKKAQSEIRQIALDIQDFILLYQYSLYTNKNDKPVGRGMKNPIIINLE